MLGNAVFWVTTRTAEYSRRGVTSKEKGDKRLKDHEMLEMSWQSQFSLCFSGTPPFETELQCLVCVVLIHTSPRSQCPKSEKYSLVC